MTFRVSKAFRVCVPTLHTAGGLEKEEGLLVIGWRAIGRSKERPFDGAATVHPAPLQAPGVVKVLTALPMDSLQGEFGAPPGK